jgi:hypothetical protein
MLGCAATTAVYLAAPGRTRIATDEHGNPLTCIAQVSLGGDHTCVLFRNGRVHCYGRANSVGTGYRDAHPDRDPVKTDARFSQIATASADTCGLAKSDSSIWCWGAAGEGGPRQKIFPARIDVLGAGFEKVAMGTGRVCGLRNGEVWCYDFGPTEPHKELVGVAELYVRNYFACAKMRSGEIQCWGSNLAAELGRGTVSSANLGQWSEPPAPVIGLGSDVASLRLSSISACAITKSRSVWCWGGSDYSLFADGRYWSGTTDGMEFARHTPIPLELPVKFRDFVMGSATACLLAEDRSVWCWGAAGYNDMLGEPSVSYSREGGIAQLEPKPRRLEPLGQDNERVFAGGAHYCVQKVDHSVWCWGLNFDRQVDRKLKAATAGLTRLPVTCPPD